MSTFSSSAGSPLSLHPLTPDPTRPSNELTHDPLLQNHPHSRSKNPNKLTHELFIIHLLEGGCPLTPDPSNQFSVFSLPSSILHPRISKPEKNRTIPRSE